MTVAVTDVQLASCDDEPIHVPGSVQTFGHMFACGLDDWRISHVSAGAGKLLGMPAESVLGRDLPALLGKAAVAELARALDRTRPPAAPVGRVFGLPLKGQPGSWNAAIHVHDGRRIVEIEPAPSGDGQPPLDLVREILAEIQHAQTLAELCDETAVRIRALIGFDRTMVYRFHDDGSGEVIAEARRPDIETYLHLRYPASDIPRQARELYLRNWVRLICDVNAEPVRIVAARGAGPAPIDMTFADLRSVSPVHIEYLRNMGVGASMSISIIVGGRLWGLIACHHGTAKAVPANVRAAAELLGQVFSLQIRTVEGIESYVTMRAARALLDRMVAEFPVDGSLLDNLADRFEQLAAFMPSDGLGAWINGAWRGMGRTPPAADIEALVSFVEQRLDHGLYATDHLASVFEPAAPWQPDVCGLLGIQLSSARSDMLFFFRREMIQTVDWAGNPAKVGAVPPGERLTPRKSFELWTEEVRGRSLPWTSRQRLIADALRVYLLDVIVRFGDVLLEERRHAQQRQRLAASELHQRVKSTLELVQSLVVRGYEDAGSLTTFVKALEGRVKAVALAHDATAAGPSDVRGLVETALAVACTEHERIELQGPDVRLDPRAYTVLALVVHELVSNAVTHGALSVPAGRLSVQWSIDAGDRLALTWEEQDGPPIKPAGREGLGSVIIRRKIPYELGGLADLHLDSLGVRARLVVPGRFIVQRAEHKARGKALEHAAARPLDGYTVLVVEDQMLTALEIERMLRERGARDVDLAGNVESALELIATKAPDVALLDVDLGSETALPVAEELARQGIPFLFSAAPGERDLIPPQYRDDNLVTKPYGADALALALRDAVMPFMIRSLLGKLL